MMMLKVGYLDSEGNITDTHWFHSAFQAIAVMVDGQELQRLQPTPGINLCVPAHIINKNKEAVMAWGTNGVREQLASLPPSLNPFVASGMKQAESGLLLPK